MPHILNEYARVSDALPCPKCGHPDWCMVHKSGRKVVCTRVPSGIPFAVGTCGEGFVHYVGSLEPVDIVQEERKYLTPLEVREYLQSVTSTYNYQMLRTQGAELRIPLATLNAFRARYHSDSAALIFPMFNEVDEPVGCRFRRADGNKWSLKGGREGVFMPAHFNTKSVGYLVEGATDALAMHALGFTNVLGRPNCRGGVHIICKKYERDTTTPLVVVADNDAPGIDGAILLANSLPNPVIVIAGPSDIRAIKDSVKLPSTAKCAILSGIQDAKRVKFKVIFRNRLGEFFPFNRVVA